MKHMVNLIYIGVVFAAGYAIGRNTYYKENNITPERKKKHFQVKIGQCCFSIGDEA